MSTYTFDLTGNIYLYILFVLLGFGLTFYTYYRTNPPISTKIKSFLIFIRTLVISLLLLLLFQPILSRTEVSEKEPKIALLLDNSESMIIEDASGNRKDKLDAVFYNNNLKNISENFQYFLFDSEISDSQNFSYDSVLFDGAYTNISNAISSISRYNQEDNIRSILLITDGSFNSGGNPLYDAEKYGKPIDIITIGDTVNPKDIKITNLLSNDIAYKKSTIPVNVNFEANGFENDSIEVNLKEDNKIIETKTIGLNTNQKQYSAFFKYSPEKIGNIRLTAEIIPLESEITKNNNSFSKYIEIRDNKRVISIFAGYPYPDVSFFIKSIENNDSYEIKKFIQKNNSSFYNYPNPEDFNETDIFVLIGFPIFSTPADILNKIDNQLSAGKSVFLITGSETDYSRLRAIEKYLPFNTSSVQKREYQARGKFENDKLSDPILKYNGKILDSKIFNNLSPIFRTELFVSPKPDANILAKVIVNNVELNEPLIIKRDFQNHRSLSILAYGIYKWKLLEDSDEEYDIYNTLMNNIISWLNVKDLDKRVNIRTSKKFYSGSETIEIDAQVLDDALNPVENAIVSVNIIDSNSTEREIQLSSIGNGRYFATINELTPGEYSYNGSASFDNIILGKDDGRFSVGQLSIEYQDLTMNSNLLKNIANSTNGLFINKDDDMNKLSEILKRENFRPFPVTNKTDYSLWNIPLILAFSILLFAIEWIIRKRKGLI